MPSSADRRWVDEGPLAAGAMAELRRVRDGDQRGVRKQIRADQRANPVYRALLAVEVHALTRLSAVDPVVRLLDHDLDDGWLVLERGAPLGEVSDWPTARAVLDRIAAALSAAHAAGIVHRDPKRDNVLATARGPVLADFGAARIDGVPDPAPAIGSPEAFAPERLAGQPASAASDRFAFGVLAWALLTGVAPFPSRWQAAVDAHRAPLPPFRPRFPCPRAVEPAVRAWLAPDPADRPGLCGVWGRAQKNARIPR